MTLCILFRLFPWLPVLSSLWIPKLEWDCDFALPIQMWEKCAFLFTLPHRASSPPSLFPVKNGKNRKPHVLTLKDMEQDSLQFDLAADSLEELFEWYQVAWDITQREMSKQYNREQVVSIWWYIIIYGVKEDHTSISRNLEGTFIIL